MAMGPAVGQESRMTLLAMATSNLPDRPIESLLVGMITECGSVGRIRINRGYIIVGEILRPILFCQTINPTYPELRMNTSQRGGNPATNRLNYDTAVKVNLFL
jgi:hypothetical protein